MTWEDRYSYEAGKSIEDILLGRKKSYLHGMTAKLYGETEAARRAQFIDAILANWSWLQYEMPDDSCFLPLVSKYAVFAHIFSSGHMPPDDIIDDLYDESMRVAALAVKLVSEDRGCSQPSYETEKEWGYEMPAREKGLHDLCYLATHPAETREGKVDTIEKVVSTRHQNGRIFEKLCTTSPAGTKLANIMLDMLGGKEE